ncbi:MAG: hypothetical protein ICV83_13610 [Cytophagales bacterium]|nr:hypothetical protein [Cytophagales bacterium]
MANMLTGKSPDHVPAPAQEPSKNSPGQDPARNHAGGRDSKRLIDRKDAIQIALKEYEGLRKEIDARTDGTKTYAWPVILLGAGTLAGWKMDINLDVVLFLIPTMVMTILTLAANASYDMDKARKALARVENRIFLLSGETLLTHESCRVIEWQENAWKRLAILFVVPLAYLASVCFLYYFLKINSSLAGNTSTIKGAAITNNAGVAPVTRLCVLIAIGGIMIGFYVRNAWGWYRLHAREFNPALPLMKRVKNNEEIIG